LIESERILWAIQTRPRTCGVSQNPGIDGIISDDTSLLRRTLTV
jgi:hypothetical protein